MSTIAIRGGTSEKRPLLKIETVWRNTVATSLGEVMKERSDRVGGRWAKADGSWETRWVDRALKEATPVGQAHSRKPQVGRGAFVWKERMPKRQAPASG